MRLTADNHHLTVPDGDRDGLAAAVRGLLADHLAQRLGAFPGLVALPLALRLRAHRLAPDVRVWAVEAAPGVGALRAALGRGAIQGLLPWGAHVLLGAEHRTVGLAAVHPAVLVGVLGRLGAPRLTFRNLAMRLAVLLTYRAGAIPSTMRHAAPALAQRDDRGNRLPWLIRRHLDLEIQRCPRRQHPHTLVPLGVVEIFAMLRGCDGNPAVQGQ
mmetsp:Transcript_58896/g.157430  ORF Transcript_58896/g.157430 Transcript_58896/m.157430 type:complete len:214 (+) Transcript_58896:727-1368(+)